MVQIIQADVLVVDVDDTPTDVDEEPVRSTRGVALAAGYPLFVKPYPTGNYADPVDRDVSVRLCDREGLIVVQPDVRNPEAVPITQSFATPISIFDGGSGSSLNTITSPSPSGSAVRSNLRIHPACIRWPIGLSAVRSASVHVSLFGGTGMASR